MKKGKKYIMQLFKNLNKKEVEVSCFLANMQFFNHEKHKPCQKNNLKCQLDLFDENTCPSEFEIYNSEEYAGKGDHICQYCKSISFSCVCKNSHLKNEEFIFLYNDDNIKNITRMFYKRHESINVHIDSENKPKTIKPKIRKLTNFNKILKELIHDVNSGLNTVEIDAIKKLSTFLDVYIFEMKEKKADTTQTSKKEKKEAHKYNEQKRRDLSNAVICAFGNFLFVNEKKDKITVLNDLFLHIIDLTLNSRKYKLT